MSQAQLYKVYSLFVTDGTKTKFIKKIKACRDKYAISKSKKYLDDNAPFWGYVDGKNKQNQIENSYIHVSFENGYSSKEYQLKIK